MYGHNISTFPSGLISSTDYQCRRDGGGGRYKLLEPGGPEGGLVWITLHMFYAFLSFSVYLYLWIVQVNPFRPNSGQNANLEFFGFSVHIFIRPALAGRHEKKFFFGSRTRSRRPFGLQNSLDTYMYIFLLRECNV